METFKKEFVNELGNTIQVQVESKEIASVPGVMISISGPSSSTENHVTWSEVEIIYEQLKLLLESKKS
jgi:hypothetical protein